MDETNSNAQAVSFSLVSLSAISASARFKYIILAVFQAHNAQGVASIDTTHTTDNHTHTHSRSLCACTSALFSYILQILHSCTLLNSDTVAYPIG